MIDYFRLKKFLLPSIFTLTSFFGATLLFIVEPMIAKILLPEFGGASNVWTTSTFFFQTLMLLGYILVHLTIKLGPRIQPYIHLLIVFPSLFLLPIGLPVFKNLTLTEPFSKLLLVLTITIGLPFLVLSTTGPLLQKWYSWTDGVRNNDPYFLYAASNAGSLIGLLSYPFLIEPFISIQMQRNIWSVGFILFLSMILLTGVIVLTQNRSKVMQKIREVKEHTEDAIEKISTESPNFSTQVWWLVLAFIPASLQLGVTTYITTDVASVPLLWIVPLSIYLTTMILAFARKNPGDSTKSVKMSVLLALSILGMILFNAVSVAFFSLIVVMALVMLSVVSYTTHSLLAHLRPETEFLTKYFVFISMGGALAGAFNGVISPLLFSSPLEFPIALTLVSSLLLFKPEDDERKRRGTKIWVSLIILLLPILTLSVPQTGEEQSVIKSGRNFYGSWSIYESSKNRSLLHENTLHGTQSLKSPGKPTSYYSEYSPVFRVYELLEEKSQNLEITIIGLGTGGIATYSPEGSRTTFIEVNPQIVEIAEDSTLFTFLSDAEERGVNVEIKVGDGRLEAEKLKPNSQNLIILDAFSSISVPVHLLTEEAFHLYKSLLKEDGVILVNISNRVFDFTPVIYNDAEVNGLSVLFGEDTLPDGVKSNLEEIMYSPSYWMAVGRDEIIDELSEEEGWFRLSPETLSVSWTDDYSSPLKALDWSKLL